MEQKESVHFFIGNIRRLLRIGWKVYLFIYNITTFKYNAIKLGNFDERKTNSVS